MYFNISTDHLWPRSQRAIREIVSMDSVSWSDAHRTYDVRITANKKT